MLVAKAIIGRVEGEFADAIGLDPAEPWGMVLCINDAGAKFTVVGDPDIVGMMGELTPGENLEIPADGFPLKRQGWPEDWIRIAPGTVQDGAPLPDALGWEKGRPQ